MPQLLASLCFLHLSFSTKKTSMKILALAALIPMMAAPAMAGPYVESKTSVVSADGEFNASQTELRVGYESKLKNGVTTVFAEFGPGYEWNKEGTPGETVLVSEVGVKTPLTKNVGLAAKLSTEYGRDTEVLDIGGEVKVRYTF
jgi:long-subunit fatty acid transport protein